LIGGITVDEDLLLCASFFVEQIKFPPLDVHDYILVLLSLAYYWFVCLHSVPCLKQL